MDDSRFAKEWEKTRSRGFARFVMTQGASWGAYFAFAVLFGEWLNNAAFNPLRSLGVLAAFIAVGCIVAPLVWHKREDRYRYFPESSSDAAVPARRDPAAPLRLGYIPTIELKPINARAKAKTVRRANHKAA